MHTYNINDCLDHSVSVNLVVFVLCFYRSNILSI